MRHQRAVEAHQAVLFEESKQLEERIRQKQALLAELADIRRWQRQRWESKLWACERRIAERQAECGESEYVVETRTSAGIVVREQSEQPWALSPFAIRTRDLQSKD